MAKRKRPARAKKAITWRTQPPVTEPLPGIGHNNPPPDPPEQPQQPPPPPRLLSKKQVLARVGLTFPTVWKLIRLGQFPAARSLGGQAFWIEGEIDAYIRNLPVREYKKAEQKAEQEVA
jgi:predicted DNA-binding transcriptional regulator AlpA